MNVLVKKSISVILALVLCFGIASVAIAKTDCDCGHDPVIFVHGIGSPLYLQNEDGSRTSAFMPETSVMVSEIMKALALLPLATLFGGWKSCAKTVSQLCYGLFGDIQCDNEGNSLKNIVINSSTNPSVDAHLKGSNRFTFSYDWRLDPIENAKFLDEYINKVLNVTGHKKVILHAYSEGGEIALSYLTIYGSDKVEKYISASSAFQGLTLVGKLFSGEISFDTGALVNFMTTLLPAAAKTPQSLSTFLKVLRYTGIYSVLLFVIGGIVTNCYDMFFEDAAGPVFACMPGMFGFVPSDYYDSAIEYCFGKNKSFYSVLIEKLDAYHQVQLNAEKTLKECAEKGMKVCIISHYDIYPMPFVGKNVYQSDGLIDSKFTSGGGKFAPIGSTYPDGYTAICTDNHNHLSPDKEVDASGCMFPESTWFIKGFCHWNEPNDLIDWLISYDGQPTVYSSESFPQFLVGDVQTETVSPQ